MGKNFIWWSTGFEWCVAFNRWITILFEKQIKPPFKYRTTSYNDGWNYLKNCILFVSFCYPVRAKFVIILTDRMIKSYTSSFWFKCLSYNEWISIVRQLYRNKTKIHYNNSLIWFESFQKSNHWFDLKTLIWKNKSQKNPPEIQNFPSSTVFWQKNLGSLVKILDIWLKNFRRSDTISEFDFFSSHIERSNISIRLSKFFYQKTLKEGKFCILVDFFLEFVLSHQNH